MNKPKVSLLLPVYNSFSYERSDGKILLPSALNSLLRQTYKDFELIILDNQSTDDTAKICNEYAKQDPRIRYVLDDQKRFAEEAITKLGGMAQAEYSLIVNDDDLWAKDYLEKAMNYMESHKDIDLVYGTVIFIHPNGHVVGKNAPPADERYGGDLNRLGKILRYTNTRNVFPINFGLFKTNVFRSILPYEDFDTLKSNVDNTLMSKFFFLGYKAEYLADMNFFYRRKSRLLNPPVYAKNMPSIDNPVAIWLYYVHHQLLFYKKIVSMAETYNFSKDALDFIKASMMTSCVRQDVNILIWIEKEMIIQNKKESRAKIHPLVVECKKTLKKDVAQYPNPEIYVTGTEETVSKAVVTAWQAKIYATLAILENLIDTAVAQDKNTETEAWAGKAKALLMAEKQIFAAAASEKNTLPLQSPQISESSLKRKLNDHPILKKIVVFFRAIYLNIRYMPKILYVR